MPRSPDQKYLRSDTTINQCTLDENRKEVGIDLQDKEHVWSEVLSFGEKFLKNIADFSLGESTQPNRGEILVTRNESSQDTRAISYRARIHERPRVALPHADVQTLLPRENEQRSLKTARRKHHTRAIWTVGHEHKDQGTQLRKLEFGGFLTNIGVRYKQESAALEQLEKMNNAEKTRLAQIPTQDDIKF